MERAKKAQRNQHRKNIVDAVYEIGDIEYCNLVVQNDEISG